MCCCTHLIGLICVDSLPVTGNRQGKIITNKPARTSEGEEPVNKSLHQTENECVCFTTKTPKKNSVNACKIKKTAEGGKHSISCCHLTFGMTRNMSKAPRGMGLDPPCPTPPSNISTTIKPYLKPVAEWRERLMGRCFPVVTFICRITGEGFNND